MPTTSGKSAYYVDFDELRELIRAEIAVRACTQYTVCKDTGISTATMSNFMGSGNANSQKTLGVDLFVTLMKWGDFPWGKVVKRRKGVAARHTDTKDQQELRAILSILEANGVKLGEGESVSQMLARIIGTPGK
jgi:hypothetical protein